MTNNFIQLINDNIFIVKEIKGKILIINSATIKEHYLIDPSQYIDYISLKGDPTDNIKGIPGVGKVTARNLLKNNYDISQISEHIEGLPPKLAEKICKNKERIYKNKNFLSINSELDLSEYSVMLKQQFNFELLNSRTNDILALIK
ncbi:hypothetical protein JW887_06265 [Candidatus Dojkabacteria bacterium]|nr:hypothetical protein [Candidatus Dojkabacteria bacterium]